MKGYSGWGYRPYTRLTQFEKRCLPTICRIAPGTDCIELEWFDSGGEGPHSLHYRLMNTDLPLAALPLEGPVVRITGLTPLRDYEFFITRDRDGGRSDTRLAQTGASVGTVVNYLHPYDTAYAFSGRSLCSPSIVRLPGGGLLASMDVFAGGAPQNLSFVFRSDDGGSSWRYVTELFPCFWGKLFCHRGALYMLAHTTEYGNLIIGRSDDEGLTWTAPVTILPGAGSNQDQGPHKAPMPVIEADGRLWTAVDYGSWGSGGHASGLISIDAEADLLRAENWSCTGFLPYEGAWPGTVEGDSRGCLEGNAVQGPDGEIYNMLRYQTGGCVPSYGKALLLKADKRNPEAPLAFHKVIDFNGGSNCKYDVLWDEASGAYWSIASEVVYATQPAQRNVLSLAVSRDLEGFRVVKRLLDFREEDPALVGFQYISFLIDGDDILFLSRTAMNKCRNHHDANYITFHRIENFRQYLDKVVE